MIDRYLKGFAGLHSNKNRSRWTAATKYRAPHKPLLLLSVIDLISQGRINTNFIELNSDLCDLFIIYWSRVMPPDLRSNIVLPFYHLTSDDFWKLVPKPGMENILSSTRQLKSISQLREIVLGAKLDEELYSLLCLEKTRNLLQTVLIENSFSPELQTGLIEQGIINKEAFQYSQVLLEQSRKQQVKENIDIDKYVPAARDQGFRRVIVKVYDHRCAICGIRMLTPDGHTVVDAAHIMSWSITHNDNIQNGMALCRLCHWTFDEGMIGVDSTYAVIISRQLLSNHNIPSHIMTLEGRGIIGPAEKILWPDMNNLHWHRMNKFRKL